MRADDKVLLARMFLYEQAIKQRQSGWTIATRQA
jgi:hypothetical protein